MSRRRPLLLAVLSAVLLAGCGGGGDDDTGTTAAQAPPTPEEQVRAAAEELATSEDAQALCTTRVTKRFLQSYYGGQVENCVQTEEASSEEEATEEILDVTVQGDRAEVVTQVTGGSGDGAGGTSEFALEGDTWKLDEYGDDYLRAVLTVSIKQLDTGGDAALSDPPLRGCVLDSIPDMDPKRMRAFVRALGMRQQQKAMRVFNRQLAECPNELSDYVARRLIDGIFGDKASPAFLKCAKEQTSAFLTITDLAKVALAGSTNSATVPALTGLIKGVRNNCAGK